MGLALSIAVPMGEAIGKVVYDWIAVNALWAYLAAVTVGFFVCMYERKPSMWAIWGCGVVLGGICVLTPEVFGAVAEKMGNKMGSEGFKAKHDL